MLDPGGRFTVDELPNVDIYPDHDSPTRFYAVPTAPRVAVDDAGKPQISLLIYGKGQGAARQLLGGQITLTTMLGLTEAERRTLPAALARRLAAASTPDPKAQSAGLPSGADSPALPDSSRIEVLSPDWQDGEVEARLTAAVKLDGKPSLMSANTCVMMASFSADQVRAVQQAWDDGLPDAVVTYRLRTQAAESASASGTMADAAHASTSGQYRGWMRDASFSAIATHAVPHSMIFQGPLALSQSDLTDSCQAL